MNTIKRFNRICFLIIFISCYSFKTINQINLFKQKNGDIINIHLESEQTITKGRMYVVKVDVGSSTVKYAKLDKGGLWIRAENKDVFTDRFFTIPELMSLPVKIIGTVVASKRRIC